MRQDFPTDTTKDFDPGNPSPIVLVRIDWIKPVEKNGLMTMKPAVPRVVIATPLLSKTKPDWKATAENIGQQFLHQTRLWEHERALRDAFETQYRQSQRSLQHLQTNNGFYTSAIAEWRGHWTFKLLYRFLPRAMKKIT